MSNPLPPQVPSESLVSSTAVTALSEAAMDHAGQQAAELVQRTAAAKPSKPGRKAPVLPAEAEQMEDGVSSSDITTDVIETGYAPIEIETEALETATAPFAGVEAVGTSPMVKSDGGALGVPAGYAPPPSNVFAQFQDKLAEVFQTTADTSAAYWSALSRVRSPVEAIELNDRHLRQQMTAFLSHSRELAVLAQKATVVALMAGRGAS